MPIIFYHCQYCGKKDSVMIFGQHEMDNLKCPICNDNNLIVKREAEGGDAFGYNSDAPKPDAYIKKERKND